jgi:hypothetical protein
MGESPALNADAEREDGRDATDANLDHGLSQGLIESTNTEIRLLTRIAYGSTAPNPSSGSHSSPSAAIHHNSQAEAA